ncbi:MAG: DUF4159 domain-containing protein [Candidatus Stahlbacteria bacterium]|nr:DUF4159 domain-containing protein [Candidatus Stahlbacteria bacterium]
MLARVKYNSSDWYNDPSILPNLASELNSRTTLRVATEQSVISLDEPNLFDYPFIFLTGHSEIKLSNLEVSNLREYLTKGGFLYVDDDYGLDKSFRQEMEKVFPGIKMEELPFSHPIYHSFYDFLYLPKIHKHDNKPPKAYGLFYQGRLVAFYTYETNISDGWADPSVHNDPKEKREEAFKFGINIIMYALMQ